MNPQEKDKYLEKQKSFFDRNDANDADQNLKLKILNTLIEYQVEKFKINPLKFSCKRFAKTQGLTEVFGYIAVDFLTFHLNALESSKIEDMGDDAKNLLEEINTMLAESSETD